jgi:hypothetical protein
MRAVPERPAGGPVRPPRPFVPRAAAPPRAPAPTADPTGGSAPPSPAADEWLGGAAVAPADPLAAADPLVAASVEGSPALVPGADAPARGGAHAATPSPAAPESEAEVAATEWTAMLELGNLAAPPAEPEAPARPTPAYGRERMITDRTLAVVPPAEAWPEDVWAGVADSDVDARQEEAEAPGPQLVEQGVHAAATPPATPSVAGVDERQDVAHPATLTNEVAPAPGDDATLGSIADEPSAAIYPPAVPDRADAYAPDAPLDQRAAPSAVYEPDSAAAWGEQSSRGGRIAARDGVVGAINPERADEALAEAAALAAARLRSLADELEAGTLAAGAVEPSARDSEVLVALLVGLLRTRR